MKSQRSPVRGIARLAAALALALPAIAAGSTGVVAAEPEAADADTAKPRKGAYLGVHIREETGHPEGGARIEHVIPDSPADEAGLREGDLILEIGGDVVRGPVALTEKIHAREPGDRVVVKLVREGTPRTLTVELGERREPWFVFDLEGGDYAVPLDREWMRDLRESAEQWAEQYRDWQEQHGREWTEAQKEWRERYGREREQRNRELADRYREMAQRLRERAGERGRGMWSFVFRDRRPKLGVQLVDDVTPELRTHLGGTADAGVLVSKVLPGTPAEKAGIRVGDLIVALNGDAVRSAAGLVEMLADKDGRTIELEVVRNGRTRTIQAELPAADREDDDEIGGPRACLTPPRAVQVRCSPPPAPCAGSAAVVGAALPRA